MFGLGKLLFGSPEFGVIISKVETVGIFGKSTWQKDSEQISPQSKVRYFLFRSIFKYSITLALAKGSFVFYAVDGAFW
jgi:hypothetical protein